MLPNALIFCTIACLSVIALGGIRERSEGLDKNKYVDFEEVGEYLESETEIITNDWKPGPLVTRRRDPRVLGSPIEINYNQPEPLNSYFEPHDEFKPPPPYIDTNIDGSHAANPVFMNHLGHNSVSESNFEFPDYQPPQPEVSEPLDRPNHVPYMNLNTVDVPPLPSYCTCPMNNCACLLSFNLPPFCPDDTYCTAERKMCCFDCCRKKCVKPECNEPQPVYNPSHNIFYEPYHSHMYAPNPALVAAPIPAPVPMPAPMPAPIYPPINLPTDIYAPVFAPSPGPFHGPFHGPLHSPLHYHIQPAIHNPIQPAISPMHINPPLHSPVIFHTGTPVNNPVSVYSPNNVPVPNYIPAQPPAFFFHFH